MPEVFVLWKTVDKQSSEARTLVVIRSASERGASTKETLMASTYTVDSDAIHAHGTDASTLVTELETQLTALNNKLIALQGVWKGSASAGFSTLMGKWHTDMTSMNTTLSSISSALHATSSEYSTAEETNTRRWNLAH